MCRPHVPIATALLIVLAVLAAGCGSGARRPEAPPRPPSLPSPWPSAADYGTIEVAVTVRDRLLFHQRDWRQKAATALVAARTLLTVRMGAGRCADYVTELYGNLLDLADAQPGEDWRPLVVLVRREPPLASACRRPTLQIAA